MCKKGLMGTLCAVMMLSVGCGSEKVVLDQTVVADAMMEVFVPQGEMFELSADTISNFYTIDTEKELEYTVFVSTSFIGEEIAVFDMTGDEDIDFNQVLEQRMEDLKESFDGYLPEEMEVVTSTGEILTNGNLICLVIGDNEGTQNAKDIFQSAE